MQQSAFSALALLAMSSTWVFAQDDAPPETPIRSAVVIASSTSDGEGGMQPMSFDVIGGGASLAFMPGGASNDMSSMLSNDQIQSELLLVDDQMAKIREIQRDMQKQISEHFSSIRSSDGSLNLNGSRDIGEAVRKIREDAEARFNDVLLPHQTTRLRQLRTHLQMTNQGQVETLTSGTLAKELDLSERQIERLKERAEEIEAELQREIRKLKKEAQEKLFDELTASQRRKLKDMLGDSFFYEPPTPSQIRRKFNRRPEVKTSDEERASSGDKDK